ncbi:hypothetical protein Tco_0760725 [Tanacetum coccineum]
MLGRKRARKEQQQESLKRQKMEDDKETDEHEEAEADELKKHLVIIKDDEIAIDAIPLATKPPMIIDYKLLKEGIVYDEDFLQRNLKIQKMNIKFRGGLLGLKRLQGFLELLLLSTAGTKVYAAGLQLLEDLLLPRG